MSTARLIVAAGAALVERDLRLFVSYRLRFVGQALAILFTTALFYYVSRLVQVERFDADGYFGFVVAGLVTLELLTATLATMPTAVRSELMAGTFERVVVSPLGPRASIVAMTVFPALLSLVVGALTLLTAATLFGLDLQWSTMPLVPFVAVLVAVSFVPLALLVAAAVLVFKQAGSAATFLVTGLSLSSGAFFPADLLPGWVAWIADIQPLTPALELMRHVVLGTPADGGVWPDVLRLLGFIVVLTPMALVTLGTAVRVCRRRGTLTEY